MDRGSKLFVGIAIVVGLPAGYAVAQASQDESTVDPPAMGPIPVPESEISRDESEEVDFSIEGTPSESMLSSCESGDSILTPLQCEALQAVAEGQLEPGSYSDEQLKRKLDRE